MHSQKLRSEQKGHVILDDAPTAETFVLLSLGLGSLTQSSARLLDLQHRTFCNIECSFGDFAGCALAS